MIFEKVLLLFWIRIHNLKLRIRIRILQKVSDPYGSGSTTLVLVSNHGQMSTAQCKRISNDTSILSVLRNLSKRKPILQHYIIMLDLLRHEGLIRDEYVDSESALVFGHN
jgi:hypothetical protein